MTVTIATGGNYTISLSDGVVHVRVWRTPHVDSETGAVYAQEIVTHVSSLAANPDAGSLLFDLSEAPYVAGPKTQTAIGEMLASFEFAQKPVCVVVGESPVQGMQLQRIVRDAAPTQGYIVGSREEALGKLKAAPP